MLVEEYAPGAGERFDVALCVYVVEHVEAPGPFLEASGRYWSRAAPASG
jgi:2-polyprenyl-3-methyl-5-hydroxy-6-metoxy-1,4-benzoquinol methylase